MPERAGVPQPDGRAALLDVGDDQHIGEPGQLKIVQHMNPQRAEAAAESDLLLRFYALLAEHQHVVVQVGLVNALEIVSGQRSAEVKPQHLGAQRGCKRLDIERLSVEQLRRPQ